MKFCFVNYKTAEEANRAFYEGKKDEEIRGFLDKDHNPAIDFLYFAQPKSIRS